MVNHYLILYWSLISTWLYIGGWSVLGEIVLLSVIDIKPVDRSCHEYIKKSEVNFCHAICWYTWYERVIYVAVLEYALLKDHRVALRVYVNREAVV